MPRGVPGDPVEDSRDDFLQQLIDAGWLQGTALGITKKVIAEGEDVLSEDQKFVFHRYVLDVFVIRECSRMGCEIPWSEMLMAHENGGLCGYCQYMADKVMGE
jgi:hypothetical protein